MEEALPQTWRRDIPELPRRYVTIANPASFKGGDLFAEIARRLPEVPFVAQLDRSAPARGPPGPPKSGSTAASPGPRRALRANQSSADAQQQRTVRTRRSRGRPGRLSSLAPQGRRATRNSSSRFLLRGRAIAGCLGTTPRRVSDGWGGGCTQHGARDKRVGGRVRSRLGCVPRAVDRDAADRPSVSPVLIQFATS